MLQTIAIIHKLLKHFKLFNCIQSYVLRVKTIVYKINKINRVQIIRYKLNHCNYYNHNLKKIIIAKI